MSSATTTTTNDPIAGSAVSPHWLGSPPPPRPEPALRSRPRPITKPARLHHIRLTRHGSARAGRWLIGLGVEYAGQPADVLIDGLHAEVRINGSVIRSLTLDPSRSYQPTGKRPGPRRKDGS